MLTAKENFRETVRGGNPDRLVNQYEAIQLCFGPASIFGPKMPAKGKAAPKKPAAKPAPKASAKIGSAKAPVKTAGNRNGKKR